MGLLASHRRLWIVIFAGLLWAPLLGQVLLPSNALSEAEARKLKGPPDIPQSTAEWSAFPKTMDGFLADHFGFRAQLTHANAVLRYAIESPTNKLVLYGLNGHLFFLGNDAVQQTMGILIRTKQITNMADRIARFHEFLSARNITFLFASPPNNSTINRPYLPRWAAKVPAVTEYDLLLQMLAARGVPFVDLRPALSRDILKRPTYLRTDTHWNALGALVARNEIVRALGHSEWTMDVDRVFRGYSVRGGGDLSRFVGVRDDVSDASAILDLSSYPRAADPLVLIAGDSFSGLFPVVWANGGRAVVLPVRACDFDFESTIEQSPSFVIFTPTERSLACEKP